MNHSWVNAALNPVAKSIAYLGKHVAVLVKIAASARSAQLLLLQIAGVFAVLYAVSFYSTPGALALGGILAVIAVQAQPDKPAKAEALISNASQLLAAAKQAQTRGNEVIATKSVIEALEGKD